jgi:hypothetical protein
MLELVRTRLRAASTLTSEISRHISEFERVCLAGIHSDKLRFAVLDYLENEAPLEFYTAPASSTGKHHPDWQSLPGGILLNTTECCIAIDRKLRIYPHLTDKTGNPDSLSHDIVFIATILSDTFKPEDYGHSWTEYSHHLIAAKTWRRIAEKHQIDAKTADCIESAVRWHLGRFTPGWDQGRDPRELDLLDFIVHELDMDFSNSRLSEVYQRRLGQPERNANSQFLISQYESASSYFEHVESKLTNLLVFFATLLFAVITASYYIGSSDVFKNMHFSLAPRELLIGILLIAFSVISLVFIGVYTELRARKIRMLEQMAAVRDYEIYAAAEAGEQLRKTITMVVGVRECPPYLRRPSEDWYTLLLITLSSGVAFGLSWLFFGLWFLTQFGVSICHQYAILILGGLLLFVFVVYAEFAWYTRFCCRLDCEREAKFGASNYGLFPKHGGSFPGPLVLLDRLARRIEYRYRTKGHLRS